MPYSFDEQLVKGAAGERVLDLALSRFGALVPVTPDEQRLGIDRYIRMTDGRVLAIEYKTDYAAGHTGNAFIETLSVSTTGKQGWAHTSHADRILYYVPVPGNREKGRIYVIDMPHLRNLLPLFEENYRLSRCANIDYYSEGYLVPLRLLAAHFQVIKLDLQERDHE